MQQLFIKHLLCIMPSAGDLMKGKADVGLDPKGSEFSKCKKLLFLLLKVTNARGVSPAHRRWVATLPRPHRAGAGTRTWSLQLSLPPLANGPDFLLVHLGGAFDVVLPGSGSGQAFPKLLPIIVVGS